MTRVVRMRRGPVAAVFEVLFYVFNAMMALLMLAFASGSVRMGTGALGLGAAAIAVLIVVGVWTCGNVILASLVLVARARRITIEEAK